MDLIYFSESKEYLNLDQAIRICYDVPGEDNKLETHVYFSGKTIIRYSGEQAETIKRVLELRWLDQ